METAQQATQPRNLTPEELALLVRSFREMRQWSQEQLAEISGLSGRTVQRTEKGEPSSVDTRRALARAFGAEDIDMFNKPYLIPTAEEMAAAKEQFEKEHVTLQVERVTTGKQLGKLSEMASASLFSEAVSLPPAAEAQFARLADYCREYADCAELYSAVDKLGVYEDLGGILADLAKEGFSVVGTIRYAEVHWGKAAKAVEMSTLYVVAFPAGKEPDAIAVERAVRYG
ncbi:MAG: helix-turn-helix domain-containing protein [Hydrogenophaga sp.]|uniref:helix-turn-helix domain-containing protein n=1 Tax=Hydrogenophaga sp. TaxID=1904254 RepID=UPI00272FD98F|nr:helix-turn-helix domain-containing protein [Hydrogenophaga sp.]MDP2249815.1 helix-turn-helix domain-containing protein [Hydrogenophaga sp.]